MKFWSSIGVAAFTAGAATAALAESSAVVENYVDVPMPPGFGVQATELEGPVFTNAEGRTLYIWPLHKQRNGYSGESPGTPRCYDEVLTVTAGLMSPYPAGIGLPDLDNRPSCTDLWSPGIRGGRMRKPSAIGPSLPAETAKGSGRIRNNRFIHPFATTSLETSLAARNVFTVAIRPPTGCRSDRRHWFRPGLR